jgi:hypothetical protein
MKTRTMVTVSGVLALAAASTATAETLLERLHADRSSYERFTGTGEWRLKERIWVPSVPDKNTAALFSMNIVDTKKEVDALLKASLDLSSEAPPDELVGGGASVKERESGLELKDSNAFGVKRSAYGLGDCVLVSNGLYGAALRLGGGKSVVKLPDYGIKGEFTVDAWFKPEVLGGTLAHLTVGPHGYALVLRLQPGGAVEMLAGGKSLGVSEKRMVAGQFTHVAVTFRQIHQRDAGWRPRDLLMFLDGYPQVWTGPVWISTLGGPSLVGNSPAGDAPFTGLVDDLRVSLQSRDFYQQDNADCDVLAQRPVPKDAPVMRGRDELVLDAALDGTNLVEGVFKASPLPAAGKPWYFPARRGKGLVINETAGMRFVPDETLKAGEGAIEFWFMPFDWDNDRPFGFQPGDPPNKFSAVFQLLGKSATGTNTVPLLSLILDQQSETKGFLIPYYAHPLQPGTWRHVVVTWQGHDAKIFINGQPHVEPLPSHPVYVLDPNRAASPAACTVAALQFGGFRHGVPGGSTVVDEIKLYRHRLTTLEIANAYQRFLANGKIQPLPPMDLKVVVNHPLRSMTASVDLLMPERAQTVAFDLQVVKTSEANAVVETRADVKLDDGHCFLSFANPKLTYGDYLFKFAFKDGAGKVVKDIDMPHSYPQPAWVDNTLGVHDGEVMPPWTPMTYTDGVMTCWGREMTIGPAGWPVKIVSQGEAIMPSAPEIRLVTDQGEIKLEPGGTLPKLVKQQPGAIETEGVAQGGGWTMTTSIRTEFDGFMKLRTQFAGPTNAEVRELRISYPLKFADEQLFGFYTGEHWFRSAHDFRILPKPKGGKDGAERHPTAEMQRGMDLRAVPADQNAGEEEMVFASNKTGRRHPADWTGKVSFLPYVTVGDDWRQFVWLAENDKYWTQSWTNPAITISRGGGLTRLNLNIIQAPKPLKEPLVFTFGLQATPIKPLEPDFRTVANRFNFGQVCGFNGWYMQAPYEGHFSFRLSPKDLDWSYPEKLAQDYRGGKARNPSKPLLIYFDRTWNRAPEDALEYNRDWRGWGDAVRYTKPVRDGYAWYINEWIRRGIMEGMYIDDAWIDPTKSLWHLDPKDNLSYKKDTGKAEDFSDREWGYEFFDYRDLLKRLRWLYLDNGVKPLIVTHVTQTPYYPVFAFVDIMLEGEDKYLSSEKESRDFITSWGIPRLRYANGQKWGVPVQWLPILSVQKLARSGLPMARWYYQQNRSYGASLLLHDVAVPGGEGLWYREAQAAGCFSDAARFMGYWESAVPVTASESNAYASVYGLPTHLAVVLVNAVQKERVLNFTLDPAKIKALLGTDQFTIVDADAAVIPPVDPELVDLKSGVKLQTLDKAVKEGLNEGDEGDQALGKLADGMLKDMETKEKKSADPDGFFEHHNFRHENGVLRLRIQGDDYRLLKIVKK